MSYPDDAWPDLTPTRHLRAPLTTYGIGIVSWSGSSRGWSSIPLASQTKRKVDPGEDILGPTSWSILINSQSAAHLLLSSPFFFLSLIIHRSSFIVAFITHCYFSSNLFSFFSWKSPLNINQNDWRQVWRQSQRQQKCSVVCILNPDALDILTHLIQAFIQSWSRFSCRPCSSSSAEGKLCSTCWCWYVQTDPGYWFCGLCWLGP